MGPRRVGKTVLIHHSIQELLRKGQDPKRICFITVDHPLYNGLGLDELLGHYQRATGMDLKQSAGFVFFDEIQYLRDWERHLKLLVDQYPKVKFIVSGSAAAALKLKSRESGAGRLTDFLLPPLTFYEYLVLRRLDSLIEEPSDTDPAGRVLQLDALNQSFIHYLNMGGYPEVLFSETIQADPNRYIKSDIIDKVLLRDLPSLYGIQDIQELNSLFTTLAYNTAQEVSLEKLSQGSGVAKPTIRKYLDYLEAAFLIRRIYRVDQSGKRFRRANFFKVYLSNPSIRSALFSPLSSEDEQIGALVETGIFSQWFHTDREIHYARWNHGEVDLVALDDVLQHPEWAVEVKWSDRPIEKQELLRPLVQFATKTGLDWGLLTTRRVSCKLEQQGITIECIPAAQYAYIVGYNILNDRP